MTPRKHLLTGQILEAGLLSKGRNILCCTAGAVNKIKLDSEQKKVAMKIHFSTSTISRNPELKGNVMRNPLSNWAPGNRMRSSLSISVMSVSSCPALSACGSVMAISLAPIIQLTPST
jgi:hypothetical protein